MLQRTMGPVVHPPSGWFLATSRPPEKEPGGALLGQYLPKLLCPSAGWGETILRGPLNFTFQSSKVPLKEEIMRERRCLLPQRRKITLSRGFCNYIHLK